MTERDVVRLIQARVKANGGNVAVTAKRLGRVSRQYLHMVLRGDRPPTHPKLLRALKLRQSFEPM
jgi:hypothetical protein